MAKAKPKTATARRRREGDGSAAKAKGVVSLEDLEPRNDPKGGGGTILGARPMHPLGGPPKDPAPRRR